MTFLFLPGSGSRSGFCPFQWFLLGCGLLLFRLRPERRDPVADGIADIENCIVVRLAKSGYQVGTLLRIYVLGDQHTGMKAPAEKKIPEYFRLYAQDKFSPLG